MRIHIWPEYNNFQVVHKYNAFIREGHFKMGMLDSGFGRIICHDGLWKMGNMKESDLHGYGRRYNPIEPTYYD